MYRFKEQIKTIRKEALDIGYNIATMDDYLGIWNKFIKWKNETSFEYSSEDYSEFLLDYYQFDVNTYTNKSKSHYQQLMRSKRILDDWDNYKQHMLRKALPKSLYSDYPNEWNLILDSYLDYCKNVNQNTDSSIKIKRDYLIRLLSYFDQNKISKLSDIKKEDIVKFINHCINSGQISKRKTFYVLRGFLNYLFIEGTLDNDLSIYVPKIKQTGRRKIPTYLKQEQIEEILNSIDKTNKSGKRDYAIIILAARLGLRISDILNIKLKDIDWKNYKLNVIQTKNKNLNVLPLLKEVGWAIIDYIKNSRPISDNEYLFIKFKYPYEKMKQYNEFNKYFESANVELKDNNKKGIHNLRHSLATNMLNNEIPLNIISSTLGDSLETTSNTYLKVDYKNLKSCALEVND